MPDVVVFAPGLGFLLKFTAVFTAILAIAVPRVRTHHPHDRFGAANWVTTTRAAMVSAVAALIGEPAADSTFAAAIGLGLAATALDGLDGWLARRLRLTSAFGARFDLEVDALLILVLSILAWRSGKAGAWVLASGLTRYAFVAAGRLWPWLRAPLPGTRRGKAICIVQIVGLLVTLVPAVRPPLSDAMAATALVALLFSFAVDVRTLSQRAVHERV